MCTHDTCVDKVCSIVPRIYGDIDGDGAVGIFDIFCVLNGFGGDLSCGFCNIDIEPCEGNGTVGIFDLFGVLNAFGGIDPCCGGSSEGACCIGWDCVDGMTQVECTDAGGVFMGGGTTCPQECVGGG